eukprot:c19805_g1_i1 orf=152-361(-)
MHQHLELSATEDRHATSGSIIFYFSTVKLQVKIPTSCIIAALLFMIIAHSESQVPLQLPSSGNTSCNNS